MRFHIWNNGGNSSGPHNWRYDRNYEEALRPQDKRMNDQHIEELVNEWLKRHASNAPAHIVNNNGALKAWQKAQQIKAREWAIKNEPKRYLNPLLRTMNGIPADTTMRRDRNGNTAILSSSWVGDANLNAGSAVTFDLGGKNYTFKLAEIGGLEGLRRCLSAPSIGSYIAKNWIGQLPSSRKNWKKMGTFKGKNYYGVSR